MSDKCNDADAFSYCRGSNGIAPAYASACIGDHANTRAVIPCAEWGTPSPGIEHATLQARTRTVRCAMLRHVSSGMRAH